MITRALSKASRVWLAVTGVLLAVGVATLFAPGPRPGGRTGLPSAFDLQGHRGARGLYPENSLPGFEAALALGVTTLEMDVGMTADGVLVVHHDRRLDPERTRGPGGAWLDPPTPALFALDFAELAAYDIGRPRPGGKVAARFPAQRPLDGVRIPALAEVLARAEARSGGTVRYNVEIKTSPLAPDETAPPAALAEALVAALAEAGVTERAQIQSFDWRALRRVQEIAPGVATVYLSAERSWLDNLERGRPGVSPWTAGLDVDAFDGSAARAVKAAGGRVWSPYFRDLRGADLREAHGLGLRVVVWTVNEPADMASLIDLGVDGIITDYPDRLRAVMAGKAMPLPPGFGPAPGG
ncbi:MAG: glycerophosphodiester phosphodiesterase [Kiloniellaceae bacterium]